MAFESHAGPHAPDASLSAIMSERGQLINVAYRLSGLVDRGGGRGPGDLRALVRHVAATNRKPSNLPERG